MNWSYISDFQPSVGGSTASGFTIPLPTDDIQDGDLIICPISFSPDDGTRSVVCDTTGWSRVTTGGDEDRVVYAIYDSSLSAPSFTVTGGVTTISAYGQAYRATNGIAFGPILNETGNPPASGSVTVTTIETLIVLIGTTPGNTSWSVSSGFSTRINDTTGPSLYFGDRIESSAGSVTGILVESTGSARNIIFSFSEGGGTVNAFFF